MVSRDKELTCFALDFFGEDLCDFFGRGSGSESGHFSEGSRQEDGELWEKRMKNRK